MPVAVITDSTACLPEQVAAQWGVTTVQLQIRANGRVDDENRFERTELVETLRAGNTVSTSPPDPGAFFWTYQDAVSAGADAIVSLHISRKLSATADAAREAAQQVRVPVYVLDSTTTSMSLGFAALSAARAAAAGAGPQRVMQIADRRYRASSELLYVDTLEYLRRGGRIGAASALLGSAMAIKPLLTVRDGEVAPLSKVPGSKRAIAKLTDLAVARAGERPVDIAVACVTPSDRELTVVQRLRERVPRLNDIMLVHASTVITAHVGPGALGITVAPVP
ncbi:fatty acid-binding protein DegV [Saccharomonospora piscinae]|uniref:Fatty acid-binding protein DegV n=1 Tax=Saccharomonospora piscinae TaxID=687388 RepID=A0A1V9A537_SACPI|nr:DegV family protein [Saccharomonospora piscinae]OQO92160.1 fatty acid-binding protein DegV [Saccharomonospora piscinae]TLW92156.1 DegV family protein [Saccharomonospora piscinae]